MLSVVGAAFCVGVLEELLPSEYGSKAYVRLLTGFCLLAIMLAPVGELLRALPDVFEEISDLEQEENNQYEQILNESLGEAVREELAAAVKGDLADRFGVRSERTDVGVMFDEAGGLSVSRLVITLRGVDILKNPYEIEDYFGQLLGCECVVIVG